MELRVPTPPNPIDDSTTVDEELHSFDVTVSSNEELRLGVTAARRHGSQHRHHRVVVGGGLKVKEAHLLAAQMASATSGIVTGVYSRI